jgi:hypothetical protein
METQVIAEVEIDDDEIINYIQKCYDPEDIFDEKVLAVWALDNGYVLEE